MTFLTPPDRDLLDRYLSNKCSISERRSVEAWAAASPQNASWFAALRYTVTNPFGSPQIASSAEVRRRVWAAIDEGPRDNVAPPSPKGELKRTLRGGVLLGTRALQRGIAELRTRTLRMRQGLLVAGITAVIAGMIFLARRVPKVHTDVMHAYATGAHQQAVIDLADGTRVTLAPQTTLRLQHFGSRSRTVVLENGEAYFEVAHAAGHPFVVRSGTTTAQVLGTAFLVRYRVGDPHVHVAVTDGKVRVVSPAHASTGLTLTAGQIGDVSDSTVRRSTVDDLAPSAEWETGHVVFRHTPVATVLRALSQWYGYQFRYEDQSIGAQSVTTVVSTRSSAQALATIEQLLAVNLTIVGDTITLIPHAPPSSQRAPRVRTYDLWTPTKEVGR